MYNGPGRCLPLSWSKSRPKDDPYFLYVGSAVLHKNLEVVFDALRIVLETNPNVYLLCAGGGGRRRDVQMVPQSPRIVVLGRVASADLAQLYAHATALVLPSAREGFGFTAFEAISLGCPVILSGIAPLREIWGNVGLFCDQNDSGQWAQAMLRLLNYEIRQDTLRCQKQILAHYSWATTAAEMADIYRETALSKSSQKRVCHGGQRKG